MIDINDYTREETCEYKGEVYSVRDNGAVLRHTPEGKKPRKLDNEWTFGKKNESNGYMTISGHRVHIIVAIAFYGEKDSKVYVVDHIDTNRCNNRVENLRWLTRLENVLLNEATLKRVTYLCGGDINKFINNPSCLRDLTGTNQDLMWMRTVTPEEARQAYERISQWAKRPSVQTQDKIQSPKHTTFEDWLNAHNVKKEPLSCSNTQVAHNPLSTPVGLSRRQFDFECIKKMREESTALKESLTKGALQKGFNNTMQFPLCPISDESGGLELYASKLRPDYVVAIANNTEYVIRSAGWSEKMDAIIVEINIRIDSYSKYNGNLRITYTNGKYIHEASDECYYFRFADSANVLQRRSRAQCHFPLCPKNGDITLEEYAKVLQVGALIEKSEYGEYVVYDRELTEAENGMPLLYVGLSTSGSIKDYGDMYIYVENHKIVHEIGRTYFEENFLKREFCKMRGQDWDNSIEVFDDYC